MEFGESSFKMQSENNKIDKIRVLDIIPSEAFGGPPLDSLRIGKRLIKDGFDTTVALPMGDKKARDILNNAGILCVQVKFFRRLPNPSNVVGILRWVTYFFPSTMTLFRLIKKEHIDIVHVDGILCLQGALAAKLARKKLVWRLIMKVLPGPIEHLLFPLLYLWPERILVTSETMSKFYLGQNARLIAKTTVLCNPVDSKEFFPGEKLKEYMQEFNIRESDKVIGTVGNISPQKGYEYFLVAAKTIKEAFPNSKFLIVGEKVGTREKYFQKLQGLVTAFDLRDDVVFAGFRSDVPRILNLLDVFVLSSINEGTPNSILEAMSCGKPVVATRVGGVSELVIDQETGILIRPKDTQSLANEVINLLNNPDRAKEMGIKGRERVVEFFDIDKCVEKTKKIYHEIILTKNEKMVKPQARN